MSFILHHGDCLDVLRGMADNSVDSIVTDPPYGLSFMGKKWDYDAPSTEIWAECLRVLKPGGHLLAFAGTRTQHRMAVRIEDAGFEIRDMIAWVYGSGMPKSHDVSKAIDRAGGASVAWFGPWFRAWREERGLSQKEVCERCGFYGEVNRGGAVANWELGFNMPTPEQFNLIRDTFGLPFESIEAAQREVVGQGYRVRKESVVQIAACSDGEYDITAPATEAARQWQGWGTSLKPSLEPVTVARKPLIGTVAENVMAHGTGALNIDGCRVATDPSVDDPRLGGNGAWKTDKAAKNVYEGGYAGQEIASSALGRWPANLIHSGEDEVVGLFPQVKGATSRTDTVSAGMFHGGNAGTVYDDGANTSAARFFYAPKASKRDRDEGLDGKRNTHVTVKPTELMRYLCRLVTPPGGVVLDPFMGSGSTGKAAMLEGFNFIGIEREAEYVEIANARINAALAKPDPVQQSMNLDLFKDAA